MTFSSLRQQTELRLRFGRRRQQTEGLVEEYTELRCARFKRDAIQQSTICFRRENKSLLFVFCFSMLSRSLGYTSSSAAAVVAGSIGCGCMCVNAEAQQARVGSDGLHVRIPELALLLQTGQRGTHLALNTACRSQVSFRRFPPSSETVDSWSCFARIISVLFFQGGGA